MKYKKYPQYKDSGVEWLGKIPEHWQLIQSRRLFQERKGRAKKGDVQLTSSQKYGVLPQKEFMELEGRKVTQVLTGNEILKHVEPNDFVISMRSFQGGLEYCKYRGSVSSAYVGLIPIKHVDSSFFTYLFKSKPYIQALQSTSNLVRDGQALRFDNFSLVDLIIVPANEQQEIANYLDIATKKIDNFITKQLGLLELLKEKRQTVVDSAIKKNDVEQIRLGRVVNQIYRPVSREIDMKYTVLGLYNRGRGLFHRPLKIEEDLGDSDFYWVEEDDLILSGQFAWEGSVALATKNENNCIVSHRYPILRGKRNLIDTEYLWAYFTTKEGDFILNEHSVGSAGRNRPLNINTLLKEKIPVPPIEAQKEVAKIVQAEQKIKILIDRAIDLLKEKRTALISAVVTGKIDVRDVW